MTILEENNWKFDVIGKQIKMKIKPRTEPWLATSRNRYLHLEMDVSNLRGSTVVNINQD